MLDIDIKPALLIIERSNGLQGSLISILQDIQTEYGYLPKEILILISRKINIPIAKILSAATFYAHFRFKPFGKYVVKICHGTACHIAGATRITDVFTQSLKIQSGETTDDMLFTLEKVSCLGCCALAPVVMINETTYGKMTPNKVKKIIEEYRKQG